MRAAIITNVGTPVSKNVKIVDDWGEYTLKSKDILIKTEASALNHLDLWVGIGMPGLGLEYPRVSGSDGCGIVTEVGSGVDLSWVGKRVLLNAAVRQQEPELPDFSPTPKDIRMIGEHDHGTNAQYFVAPVNNVLDVGDIDPIQADKTIRFF